LPGRAVGSTFVGTGPPDEGGVAGPLGAAGEPGSAEPGLTPAVPTGDGDGDGTSDDAVGATAEALGVTTGAWQLTIRVPKASTATMASSASTRNPTTRCCEIVSLLIGRRV
jgi:hypothetical protein